MSLTTIRKVIASALLLLASSAVWAETFVFTAIPDEDETKLIERFRGVADYLSEQLDVEVRYIPVKSYAAAVSAFRNNQVQLAWFGGLSGVQARRLVPGSEALAQGVEDQAFQTYFIANTSTGIAPAQDLKELTDSLRGKTFTFGSKGSTSGRLMPEFFLRQAFGTSPEDVFDRVGFSGNHTRTLRLVEAGTYQVGALNFQVWQKELEDGNIDESAVRVIWQTPPYPDYQWTIRGDVDQRFGEGFKAKVRQALLDLDDPELLKSFPRSGFVPASNDDYEPIRETAEAIGILD
ncbi:putative selenate ABC transporter substrate-binding protein [Marinobacter lutaoensis]|jgi:phosphonate transport system substrate-binding protein|uniref:putative selenate ABC transporter substrate-binding protein n=1 Tax=Marinobacter lutaoensis TaxID=135739 RepID=UPI000C09D217|nr:putative selenate ABC transporter substrate-binding protein [Marinobacter lutaoensis]MBE03180.1 putative selenate ABC transporter substrate-binding protein [Marinobacter sp.]MBI42468.1 putative selenate ABC transporter substrate-binding protein [Oceanospirillales bacterium]NVD35474.1 putative selenate ABC transporter substrate-binding protein [Marinobacter lutaoensis]